MSFFDAPPGSSRAHTQQTTIPHPDPSRREAQASVARQKNFLSKIDYVDPNYTAKQAGVVMSGMTLGFAFSAVPFAGVALGPAVCGAVVGGGLHKLEEDAKKVVGDPSCLDNLLVTADNSGDLPYVDDPTTPFEQETEARVGFVPSWELNKTTSSKKSSAFLEDDDDDPFSELISTRHSQPSTTAPVASTAPSNSRRNYSPASHSTPATTAAVRPTQPQVSLLDL